jgi:transglutaminase-like putative cysteine protease
MARIDAVSDFAGVVAAQAGWQILPFLDLLTRRLHQEWQHVIRPEGPPESPATTLRVRQGSCRDLSTLFCAVCRSAGIAARFVSGYETESAFQEHAYMHAWAEVYIPGGGWRGYDPSRGVAVATSHVAVAAAVDAASAAPISGSYRGSAASRMEFTISMQIVD